ncbi:LysR family glycine cleavage system transcriptional activator [Phyllobacterium myrsinacearum]|uniref:LysR family glycine cleavage system transcriptional activator n=1 Tax=Phyllobacterium myrsinacearum TaxID=28101 RepID=A0A839EJ84_9HYPH|nr:LysR family glycine cleavage system transcriptional activator [Phyllobacterium myrsinacearum]
MTSLRAFVATARHLSFTRAAEELHVTSAAIGQQIRLLEDHLGKALFHRTRGQLQLTEAGNTLMPGLTDAFDAVLESVARLVTSDHDAPIKVSVAPSFASKWLIPRLDALRRAAPDLEVLVDASTQLADLEGEETDCVIRYGTGAYPGLVVDRLFSEAVLPVCSPAFAQHHGLYRGSGALQSVPLLHEEGPEHDSSCPNWTEWSRSESISGTLSGNGFRLSQSSLVLDAAIAGQGIGLGKLRLAEADIAAGRLVSPFGTPQPVEFSYYFATTAHKAKRSRVERFRNWLGAEARALRTIEQIAAPFPAQSLAIVAAE